MNAQQDEATKIKVLGVRLTTEEQSALRAYEVIREARLYATL